MTSHMSHSLNSLKELESLCPFHTPETSTLKPSTLNPKRFRVWAPKPSLAGKGIACESSPEEVCPWSKTGLIHSAGKELVCEPSLEVVLRRRATDGKSSGGVKLSHLNFTPVPIITLAAWVQ